MKPLKFVFNFYINSSIHVALATYALTWITLIQFGFDYDKSSLYFVFFASITGYNFVKYFGLAKFHHRSLAKWLRAIQIFSGIAFIVMLYYLFQLNFNTIVLIGFLGLITFLYAIPLIPMRYFFDEQQNLREVGGLKIYVIALVWVCTTIALPLVNNEQFFDADVIITMAQRFCYILVLMLPFEIRDLNYDSLKLATIPQKIGIKKTKIIGVLLLMVFLMLEFFKNQLTDKSIITMLIITFVTLLFLVFSNKNQSKSYSAFWVEGLPVLWLLLVLLIG